MANTETTLTSAKAWSPDVTAIAPRDGVPDALVLQTSTVAGRVEGDDVAVRVMFVDDATAGFVPEGQEISEADPDLSECVVMTGKIAQLIRLSREQFVQPNAQELLAESVRRAVTRAADVAYIAQAAPIGPAVTPPAGLLNVAGIEDGGNIEDDLDGLIDLQATIAGNGGTPSHIVLSPTAWAGVRKFKQGTGSAASLLGAGTADTVPMLLGVPVLVTSALPANTGMMLDRNAIVSAVGDVLVSVSQDVYFAHDSVGLRATWRIGSSAVHPDRIGKFTVGVDES